MTTTPPKSIGFECKHVHYVQSEDGKHDLLAIKEHEHFEDGTTAPRLRLIKDYQRQFWITRPNFQNHQEKKEWEDQTRLQEFKSTQTNLVSSIRRAMGQTPTGKDNRLTVACRSPYVYGADVTSATIVKHYYMEKWSDLITINTMAAFDSETSMVTEEIIMLSITYQHRARLIVVRDFVKQLPNPEAAIRGAAELYLGEILRERKVNLEIEFVANAGECAKRTIETAHEWKPDFLAAWNMDFDVPKIIEALVKYGYDPNQVFCDPAIPPQFRRTTNEGDIPRNFNTLKEMRDPADFLKKFGYRQGRKSKVSASGVKTALAPAEQWHQLQAPASWYMIDPMCVYYRLRIANGKDPSYALDAVLGKEKIKQKLKFDKADHLHGGAWHMFMQEHYPAEYCVYNIYDSIALEKLDEKTTDLGRQISALCGHSEYHRFPSQPRRLCDDLHFFGLERKRVIGTTSDQMEIELDKLVISLDDHIVTLPSFSVAENGVKCVEETPNEATMVYAHVAD
jgi:hypothetical protein